MLGDNSSRRCGREYSSTTSHLPISTSPAPACFEIRQISSVRAAMACSRFLWAVDSLSANHCAHNAASVWNARGSAEVFAIQICERGELACLLLPMI